MNREIKFRAFEKGGKQIYEVQELGMGDGSWEKTAYGSGESPTGYTPFYPTKVEVMQFTGLLDRNGKEIFEGDVLRYDNGGTYEEIGIKDGDTAAVEYKVSRFLAKVDLWVYGTDGTGKLRFGEVIGNVWENPELLEVK